MRTSELRQLFKSPEHTFSTGTVQMDQGKHRNIFYFASVWKIVEKGCLDWHQSVEDKVLPNLNDDSVANISLISVNSIYQILQAIHIFEILSCEFL